MEHRCGLSALVAAALLLASCAHAPVGPAGPTTVSVDRDTVWSGEVRVAGIVHVRKGATLSILPGTRVLFVPGRFGTSEEHEGFAAPGIRVEGRIVAAGADGEPIVFTSAGAKAFPGSWDKILFSFSAGSVFDRCVFEGARYAIHAHFSEIALHRCVFRDNDEGVRLGQSRVTIEDSVFTRNEVRGINFRECRNVIRGNLVYGNGDGIFLHSKDGASVIRGNAIYANRGFNLRLGDLHVEDIDASENWWGTSGAEEARRTIYDGGHLPGLGTVRLSPVLARPPVSGAEIRGVLSSHLAPIEGAEVRAYPSVAGGMWTDAYAASATTDAGGRFRLAVPPGRYFVVSRADSAAGPLFAFPGRNPVAAGFGEQVEVGLPAVAAPPRPVTAAAPGGRAAIVVRATRLGKPEPGVTVQASDPAAPDFRGPGRASAVTGDQGTATLVLPPGRYHLAARKRASGAPLGMVDEGGLFGVSPYSPVELPAGMSVLVEIPLFEKRGWLGGDERAETPGTIDEGAVAGTAVLGGRPAEGYIVYFYRAPETIGRPAARSSSVAADGGFRASVTEPGEYIAYLRKSVPGVPGGAEEERLGPVPLRIDGGRCHPNELRFAPAAPPAVP